MNKDSLDQGGQNSKVKDEIYVSKKERRYNRLGGTKVEIEVYVRNMERRKHRLGGTTTPLTLRQILSLESQ